MTGSIELAYQNELKSKLERLCKRHETLAAEAEKVMEMDADTYDPEKAIHLLKNVFAAKLKADLLIAKFGGLGEGKFEDEIDTCIGLTEVIDELEDDLLGKFSEALFDIAGVDYDEEEDEDEPFDFPPECCEGCGDCTCDDKTEPPEDILATEDVNQLVRDVDAAMEKEDDEFLEDVPYLLSDACKCAVYVGLVHRWRYVDPDDLLTTIDENRERIMDRLDNMAVEQEYGELQADIDDFSKRAHFCVENDGNAKKVGKLLAEACDLAARAGAMAQICEDEECPLLAQIDHCKEILAEKLKD